MPVVKWANWNPLNLKIMNKALIVYSKQHCTGCMLTKNFLKERDIAFEDRSITDNDQHVKAIEQMGYKTVPIVVFPDGSSWAFQGSPTLSQLETQLKEQKLLPSE